MPSARSLPENQLGGACKLKGRERAEQGANAAGAVTGLRSRAVNWTAQVAVQTLLGDGQIAENRGDGTTVIEEIVVIRIERQRLRGGGTQFGVIAIVLQRPELLFEGGAFFSRP